jgi:hypothetical protein
MIVGQFSYKFEDLPSWLLKGGGESGYVNGEALIQFDVNTRRWDIEGISIRDERRHDGPLVELERDEGENAVGMYEILYDAIKLDRDEAIQAAVDRIIDTENAEGKAR